jgi:hypothetical protein
MLGNKYLAAVVGLLLILVAAYNIKFFSSKNRPAETVVTEKTGAVKPSEPIKTDGSDMHKKPERVMEAADKTTWKRDPFDLQAAVVKKPGKKPEKKPAFSEDIRLIGIVKRDGKSHALINGSVYRVNDKIGDAVITEINKNGIVLSSGGENKRISFEDYIILKEKSK